MPGRKQQQSTAFKIYVLVVCAAWIGVPVAALWGLDWRWIPTAFVAAVVALIAGGLVENWAHERAEKRAQERLLEPAPIDWPTHFRATAEDRDAHRAAIAAEEEAWLGGRQEQP
jgi:undecaprenyl pyrophosphate phosphatase UppP